VELNVKDSQYYMHCYNQVGLVTKVARNPQTNGFFFNKRWLKKAHI